MSQHSSNRNEQRRARALQHEQGISYTEALDQVRAAAAQSTSADPAQEIRAWAGEALTGLGDPLVPLPPDAKVTVRAVGLVERFPHTTDDRPAPEWVEVQRFELVFTLRADERPETISELPWRLREAASADRTLGGRVRDAWIPLDPDDPEDHQRVHPQPAENGWAIRTPLVLTEPEG